MIKVLASAFTRPRLMRVERPHAGAVLGAGRAPVHIVAEGVGVLRVGDVRRFVRGRFDDVVFVAPGAVTVVFRGLLGAARAQLAAVPVLTPAPAHLRLVRTREPERSPHEQQLVLPEPRALQPMRPGALVRRMAPGFRGAALVVVPAPRLRTERLRPRVRLPEGGTS